MKQREILNALSPDFSREGQKDYILTKKNEIVAFIKSYLTACNMDGYIIGISGGIDSFLVGALLAEGVKELNKQLVLVMLPNANQKDIKDSIECCQAIKAIYEKAQIHTLNIEKGYDGIQKDFSNANLSLENKYALGNIQARLRMVYQYAINSKLLVAGTDHATEAITGFYTKFGDGGSDVNPISQLIKDDIYLMSELYSPPKCVMVKKPSAGLGISDTDEEELNLKYEDICKYLRGGIINEEVAKRLEHMYDISAHKRKMPACIKEEVEYNTTHIVVDFIHAFIDGSMPCENALNGVKHTVNYINANPMDRVLYVCDAHPSNHCSFKENGGIWQPHALINSKDAQIHPSFTKEVKKTVNSPVSCYNIFYKGEDAQKEEYSGFNAKNKYFGSLKQNLTKNITVSGVATEFCVKNTVLDLLKEGYKVSLLKNALGYVNKKEHEKSLKELEDMGAIITGI